MPTTADLPEIESNVPDANDCGLGGVLFPFSGLPLMGCLRKEEHGVVGGRQSQPRRTLAPAQPRFAQQACFRNLVHKSDLSKSHRICLLGSMIPSNFLRKFVCRAATHDSSPQEVALVCSPLESGMLWRRDQVARKATRRAAALPLRTFQAPPNGARVCAAVTT